MEVKVRLENVTPETWAALKVNNRYHIPLEAEHDSGWHEWVDHYPESVLLHLEDIGSPRVILYQQLWDYEGYKNEYWYQLDSPHMKRIEKFNQKLCNVLGLNHVHPRRNKSRCPAIERQLSTSWSTLQSFGGGPIKLNDDIRIDIGYCFQGGFIHYNVHLRTFKRGKILEDLTMQFGTHKLRHIREVLDKIRSIAT